MPLAKRRVLEVLDQWHSLPELFHLFSHRLPYFPLLHISAQLADLDRFATPFQGKIQHMASLHVEMEDAEDDRQNCRDGFELHGRTLYHEIFVSELRVH